MDLELLFEYKGSKSTLKCAPHKVVECITKKMFAFGYKDSQVSLATDMQPSDYILQRFSYKWDTFVDLNDVKELCDGDRVTVILHPQSLKVWIGLQAISHCCF